MKKIYDHKKIEKVLYDFWEKNGYFEYKKQYKNNFCIVMPPPNITGDLHMGHAFQHTIMDIIIRYNKMIGKNILWQPGTDHAGIATQIIVKNYLFSKYKYKKIKFSKKKFLKIIWQWKDKMQNNICSQIRRLGSSVNWKRNCFTMDKNMSHSVKFAFISLYKKKLIYKKKSLVNWDFSCKSVISDIEIEKKKCKGFMWYIKYYIVKDNNKIKNKEEYITVATTRPETLLGDVAVAVNPKDSRYKNFLGKNVLVPIVNRIVPIISDKSIKKNKGTGCVKITPAHDFHDYKIACDNKLPLINIFTDSGNICNKFTIYFENNVCKETSPKFLYNLDKYKAREKILKFLKKENILEKTVSKNIKILIGDRTGSLIEPRITDQWYLKVKKISKKAFKLVKNGLIEFIPEKYRNIFFSWMENIDDWCISRQLFWGHKIPAWYDSDGKIYVGINRKEIIKKNLLPKNFFLKRDKDVLDTWFSSAIWSFSSLGWPKKNDLLKMFHPTDVLVSGFDIIFFWISRMIMLTLVLLKGNKEFPVQIPFKKVYITGLIRDEIGNKMSKSKGNVIDPIDIIDGISLKDLLKKRTTYMFKSSMKNNILIRTKNNFPNGIDSYGADALRFTLASLSSPTRNINWDMKRLKGYKSFCNKIWNINIFIFSNISRKEINENMIFKKFNIIDIWIISKYNIMIKKYRYYIDNFRFDKASVVIYNFIWNSFCNWYLEFLKIIFKFFPKKDILYYKNNLIKIFQLLLVSSHPIIPFITESIWQKIKFFKYNCTKSILLQKFPSYKKDLIDKNILYNVTFIKKFLRNIRSIRNKIKINFSKKISVVIKFYEISLKKIFFQNINFLIKMANLKKIILLKNTYNYEDYFVKVLKEAKIIVIYKKKYYDSLNIRNFINKIKKINFNINSSKNKLSNKNFLKKAPKNIIKFEKNKIFNLIKIKKSIIKKIKSNKQLL
ncbi:valine--tRNA ligase [Buchnera aphidicola (Pseudoregma panicola)]|uniref:valine--tRNA ligase n=1 Tax=Buchnera aphidicola TaxID=9 RepID=UPI0031B68F24